jgi:coenzyme F420 biosynthesis associated uncharacterized protein
MDTIDWGLAERVARRSRGRQLFADPAGLDELQRSYEVLTVEAEGQVAEVTGLVPSAGPARVRVTDRDGWIRANVHSFERLLRPLTDRLVDVGPPVGSSRRGAAGAALGGTQLGLLLGWMSGRVLGQYDLLVVEEPGERPDEQDVVYYVGPNLYALERRFAFPPDEFRLWVALHECTHRAQFTGVPWLRPYFLEQVRLLLADIEPDGARLGELARRTLADLRAGRRPLDRGGLAALFATDAQQEVLDRLGGLMSLLEGHGEVVMNRAGGGRIPSAWRFRRVLRARRQAGGGPNRLLNRMLGFEAKLNQYAEGERFIDAVEAQGGRDLFDRVWQGPDQLPTLAEIRAPQRWIERVGP